ncbi:MAG: deoxyribonuclease IV [Methanosaeta sp. NSM2]|nr:deoxyribonuclease IV [Methanothrix sp.]OYV12394.1 MAG: deoxyribonuclease IV [Methanosaeta sp. NSM2]
MLRLGVHVSVAGGIERAVSRAQEKGCDAFQIFSSNPRGWLSSPISRLSAERFVSSLSQSGLFPAVDHMPYLPNLASARDEVYQKSVQALALELDRCRMLGISYLVTHLGSHLGAGRESGMERIVSALEAALEGESGRTVLLLENSSGTRNSVGSSFQEIATIIDSLPQEKERIGVCLDTCHLHAAGYDLRSSQALESVLEQFRDCIKMEHLRLIHLNDCRGGLGAHLDRHEHIGLGQIGEEGFRAVLSHPALSGLPMILETPQDSRRDDLGNLETARRLASRGE